MTTLAELLETLRRLHLLEPAQLETLTRQWGRRNVDPRSLAKKLVEQGLLTHFQANQLFKGKGNDLLLGSYVLLELLGEGGMGAVYKARNWKLGQVVAVKLIRKERLANANAVKRFQREIRASAQLDHPNIVRALDADAVGGTHLLVMEHVAGGQDLHKLVRTEGRLPIEQACRFLQQAAMGLQHAFERGLVHRDIKPHNLLVSGESPTRSVSEGGQLPSLTLRACGNVKILDFGLARLGESDDDSSVLTQEGSVMGTMDYLAPEQARDSHTADIRADLYSLGCTMYFLLTGQAPFPGGSVTEKMLKHQFNQPTPLLMLRPEVPEAVADIVDKLMAKRPEDRYQTPAELALDLEAFLSGQPVGAAATAVSNRRPADASDTSQALQETHNPFAGLSHSPTAADEPPAAPSARVRLSEPKAPAGNRRQLMRMAGAAAAVVVLIVTLAVVFSRKPPPAADRPKIVQPKTEEQPPINLLARAEKLAQEEEAAERKRKAEEEAARQKWLAEADEIRTKRAAEAEEPFKLLEARFTEKDGAFTSFAKEVAAFKAKHGGTPAAIRAAELLMKLPSPLDQLNPKKLPQDCLDHWRAAGREPPAELVAVLGEHRGRHGDALRCVIFSPNRKLIASSGTHIRIWDAETLHERMVLRVPDTWVNCLAFSPNGKLLLSGGYHGDVRLWDFDSGKLIRQLVAHEGAVSSVAFSSDGSRALTSGKTIVLCDVESGKEVGRFDGHTHLVTSAAFSPDDARIVSTSYDTTVRVWDVAKREEIRRFENFTTYITDRASFSPDGERILFGDHAGVTRLWEAKTGKELLKLGASWPLFSRDGKRILATDNKGQFTFWDAETGKQLPGIQAHAPRPSAAAMSHDGTYLVTGETDGAVRVWDMETAEEVHPRTGHASHVWSVAFSPDGQTLASGSRDHAIKLWDLVTARELRALKGHTEEVRAVAFSPDGKTLVSGGDDSSLKLWDTAAGKELRTIRARSVLSVASSPDGKTVASGSSDGAVKLWESVAGAELRVLTHNTVQVYSLAFSPDGKTLASGSHDGTVKVWNPATGTELRSLSGHTAQVISVAFSPDGKRLASGSHDATVTLWDLAAPSELRPLKGHTSYVTCVAFSPDGKLLASAGFDGRISLWEPATGGKLTEWQLPGPVNAVAFAVDGRHLATGNANGTVYLLRIPKDVFVPVEIQNSGMKPGGDRTRH